MDKVAYLHGRLGPHIMHGRLAKSINGEFHIVDEYKKWNDGEYSKIYLLYAWIFNALAFKNIRRFKYFLVSGPHFSPVIMKFLRLKKDQKLIAHMGDETMYFLYSNWYGSFMKKVLIRLLNQYDAIFCEGKMAAELAILNGIDKPIIKVTYLGVPEERMGKLQKISTSHQENHFVFISAGPSGWRTFYKGLDLMLDAYALAFDEELKMQFTIIGEWDQDVQEDLCKNMTDACRKSVRFVGRQMNIKQYLKDASFYFHTARGDAFPTVVLEAMAAGLIPLVSEWTGSKEVCEQIDKELIVEIDKEEICKKLQWLCDMPVEKRIEHSSKARELSASFTEEFALEHYQRTFAELKKEFGDPS